ncbi:hypothetical protein DFH29DRAFT_878704 [Suillus ampliporus]|nr:hypothetical protein DFH29DRAFT_878704 [Suillus ampliporus]
MTNEREKREREKRETRNDVAHPTKMRTDEHFPLGHQQFDCWAAAMCKDTSEAMLEKPPNHRLFNAKATAISPVLQSPVINFSFGNEFASFLKMNHAALNVLATNIEPAPDSTSSLLPPSSC